MLSSEHKVELHPDHPTAMLFLDETGSISADRFFAVGCLKLEEPDELLRRVQHIRDKHHWYKEFHYSQLTRGTLHLHEKIVDLATSTSGVSLSVFVADRQVADPVARFGTTWMAYTKMATQLILGSVKPYELVTVLADKYSTPESVKFEQDVKAAVNTRLSRLAVTTVVRQDSLSSDALQVVDMLTAAITFEFRQAARIAGARSAKADLAAYVRNSFGVKSVMGGAKTGRLNVAVYDSRRRPGRGVLLN